MKLIRGKNYFKEFIYGKAIEDLSDRVNTGLFLLRKDRVYQIEGIYHYGGEVEDCYIVRMDKGEWQVMKKSRFIIVDKAEG